MQNKISIYHIDDDIRDIKATEKIINKLDTLEYLGHSTSIEDGLKFVNKNKPSLLLLDIEMPEESGISVAKRINNKDTRIIFLSAYPEYALNAFECFAFNFLVKPLKQKDLEASIERFKNEYANVQIQNSFELQLKELLTMVHGESEDVGQIFINTQKRIEIVQISNIAYVEADGAYTHFHLKDGSKILSSKLLKTYTELLTAKKEFSRVHRAYIVNKKFIKQIEKKTSTVCLIFENGNQIEFGKNNIDHLLNSLK